MTAVSSTAGSETTLRWPAGRRARVAILQKSVRPFRVPVFQRIAASSRLDISVLTGSVSAGDEALGFDCRVVRTLTVTAGNSRLLFHPGAIYNIIRGRYDVVICEGSLRVLTSVVLALAKPLIGTRVVWWSAFYDPDSGDVRLPTGARAAVLRLMLRNVDAFITYSDAAAAVVRAELGAAHRVVVAPNVLDTEVLARAERTWRAEPERLGQFQAAHGFDNRPVVLFVGRLIPPKRLADLLFAFHSVVSHCGDSRPLLVVVGSGPEEGAMRALASELGIGDDVSFVGEVRDPSAICPYFLSASVFVLPGSGGLAIYQALANGIPVVATVADGTERDLIRDGENGFLVDRGDVPALGNRMMRVLSAPSTAWVAMSREARRIAHEVSHVDRMVAAFEAAVALALEPHERRVGIR